MPNHDEDSLTLRQQIASDVCLHGDYYIAGNYSKCKRCTMFDGGSECKPIENIMGKVARWYVSKLSETLLEMD